MTKEPWLSWLSYPELIWSDWSTLAFLLWRLNFCRVSLRCWCCEKSLAYFCWLCLYLIGKLAFDSSPLWRSGEFPSLTFSLLCRFSCPALLLIKGASNGLLEYYVCIKDELVEFASAVISVKCRFFLAFLPWFYCFLSCCAIACLALMNCSVLFMERIMSL